MFPFLIFLFKLLIYELCIDIITVTIYVYIYIYIKKQLLASHQQPWRRNSRTISLMDTLVPLSLVQQPHSAHQNTKHKNTENEREWKRDGDEWSRNSMTPLYSIDNVIEERINEPWNALMHTCDYYQIMS